MKITRAEPSCWNFHDEKLGVFEALFFRSRRVREGFNQRMFDEDFARIFHHSNRRSGDLFELTTNNDQLVQRLLGNVKTRYGPSPIDEAIREMVEEIAQSLVWHGKAFYFLHDDHEKEETHIASYRVENIFRFAVLVFQFLPKRLDRDWDREDEELGRELRLLNKTKLLHFHMPGSIRRMLSAQNSVLGSLDKHHGSNMDFLLQATHENPNPRNDFDFRVWRDTQDLALYRASRDTGWKGRKYDSTKRSAFFDCYRLIRFRRNQLKLRDQILVQLGDELTRVGNYYENGFHLKVSPTNVLPSVTHLNELEARFSREEVGFTEIRDFC